jgi:hypothetical protein
VLRDYRDRVHQYYADERDDAPDAFRLMRSVRIVVVVSLMRVWVFAQAGIGEDEVIVDERWEDPALSSLDIAHAPNHEAQARK